MNRLLANKMLLPLRMRKDLYFKLLGICESAFQEILKGEPASTETVVLAEFYFKSVNSISVMMKWETKPATAVQTIKIPLSVALSLVERGKTFPEVKGMGELIKVKLFDHGYEIPSR